MGNKVAKIVKGEAKKHNKKRKFLKTPGITIRLATKDGMDGTLTETLDITLGTYYDYDSFKERVNIRSARLDTPFEEALLTASDVIIGTDEYEIDKRDIQRPDGDRPYWLFHSRMNTELY